MTTTTVQRRMPEDATGVERVEPIACVGRGENVEHATRAKRVERVERVERAERSEHAERLEPREPLEALEALELTERLERLERSERSEPSERSERPERPHNSIGTVIAVLHDDVFLVTSDDGALLTCKRAFSCLITPAIRDRVAVCGNGPRHGYVAAILERAAGSETCIRVEGDLRLDASGDVRVSAAREIALEGERLAITTHDAELTATKSTLVCDELEGRIGLVRLLGKTIEAVVEHIVQISKTSFRSIDTVDHLRAAHIDYAASESVRLHGKNTLLSAEHLSKLDAEQIHLG
ncbi:DUF3540 domain-containing protein [Paraburkholderia polaris]|uniref:DUF3540 domain-containing protein n=1 Tax=Paraburkholderia polaris TaxID=2728848 RepID=UPI001E36789F|nr:DUF3540 domain-containing protein [Paraburkholderia polaris]